jgi:hypothetical protein
MYILCRLSESCSCSKLLGNLAWHQKSNPFLQLSTYIASHLSPDPSSGIRSITKVSIRITTRSINPSSSDSPFLSLLFQDKVHCRVIFSSRPKKFDQWHASWGSIMVSKSPFRPLPPNNLSTLQSSASSLLPPL